MNKMMRNMAAASIAALAAFAACTGDIGSELATGSGSTESSGSGNSGGSGGGIDFTTSSSSSSTGGNENLCGALDFSPELIGVDMFISVDKSGSMNNDSKWVNAKNAFTSFFQSPEADNLSVAIRFWPEGQCEQDICNIDACATPAVALGSLSDPMHEQALIDAFNVRSPGGRTPMGAAIAGATQWALAQQQNAEVGRRAVVIFLSDGIPNECNPDTAYITSHPAAAYQSDEILTFAVGLQGAPEDVMNAIAAAGGTNQAYFIGNGNAEQDLLQALKDIQEVAVSCTFALPESPDPTKELDPNQVDITYDPGDGSDPVEIPQVADESECGSGGWYYDDNENPAVIFLCDESCTMINDVNRPDGKLDLEAGCRLVAE
jgi:hypothetical protein